MKLTKYFMFIVFGLLFGLLGFYREHFFIHYNNTLYHKYHGESTLAVNPSFQFFLDFPYKTLYYFKYIFTFLFVILFYILSFFCVKYYTSDKKLVKWLTYSYIGLLTLSAILMLWSVVVVFKFNTDEYTVSRWLLGIAQSPLPALFFIATSKLNEKTN